MISQTNNKADIVLAGALQIMFSDDFGSNWYYQAALSVFVFMTATHSKHATRETLIKHHCFAQYIWPHKAVLAETENSF